jgi:DNA-binding transcriptional MocR family regulator
MPTNPQKRNHRKSYANGRSKTAGAHIRHYPWQMDCPAWRALSPTARCLEMELKALYNSHNNGDLFLSVREAAYRLGVVPNTAMKAFRELEEKGFIYHNQKGGFDWKVKHATSWVLTEFEFRGKPATKDFMRWHLTVKTRTQNMIPTVSIIATTGA